MSTPVRHDLEIWIGADFSQQFELINEDGTDFDLRGSELVFRSLGASGEELFRASSSTASAIQITNEVGGEFSIDLTADESRTVALGRACRFEIERRISSSAQEILIVGFIIGKGGSNDD